MNAIQLIARRELASYFNTVWGWSIVAVLLLLDGLFFNAFAMGDNPRFSSDVLEDFFYFSSGTTMAAGILFTMRVLAEERQSGTLVVLQSAPIRDVEIVVGKFLGAFGFLALLTLATAYMPALILVNGKIAWGQVGAGYLGLLALGSATTAIGTFASSVSKNQLISGVTGAGILTLLLLGWLLGKKTDAPVSDVLSYLAFFDRHFQPFMRGKINTESLIYFASVSFAFLFFATRALESRRWR